MSFVKMSICNLGGFLPQDGIGREPWNPMPEFRKLQKRRRDIQGGPRTQL